MCVRVCESCLTVCAYVVCVHVCLCVLFDSVCVCVWLGGGGGLLLTFHCVFFRVGSIVINFWLKCREKESK